MDIKIKHENQEYVFTVRMRAEEIYLELTGYKEDKITWSSFAAQYSQERRDFRIIVPEWVASAAIAELKKLVKVSKEILITA